MSEPVDTYAHEVKLKMSEGSGLDLKLKLDELRRVDRATSMERAKRRRRESDRQERKTEALSTLQDVFHRSWRQEGRDETNTQTESRHASGRRERQQQQQRRRFNARSPSRRTLPAYEHANPFDFFNADGSPGIKSLDGNPSYAEPQWRSGARAASERGVSAVSPPELSGLDSADIIFTSDDEEDGTTGEVGCDLKQYKAELRSKNRRWT
ncbi:hypothetical protein H2198_002190 [Neophaeococcomyces mojaviensis]|uniref:Uncharacterized protein n=1 Tax=Neophaeococcomyces mojaviensis TaxID=3383035 RepID=A0ACC3AEV7_9EURO|nr:hypothetical protein H2198_002190 [Knufia sp. JES_112]